MLITRVQMPHSLAVGLPLIVAGTLIALFISFATSAQTQTLLSDDFEDGNATGWTPSGGSWSVATDGSTVYRQSSTSSDARARAGSSAWTDYAVQARVKPLAFNGTDRFVALLARAQSATSYYYLALRSSNRLELKRLVGGSSTTLAATSFTVTAGTWYTLRLEVSGTTLRGAVNGAVLLTATDSQFASGNVGGATFNASAEFDDFIVTSTTGSPTPTPTATPTATPTPTPTPAPTPTPTPTPAPTPTPTPTPPPGDQPIGFASLNGGVTGGQGGPVVTVTNGEDLATIMDTNGPYIIYVSGTVNMSGMNHIRSNKTVIGLGANARIVGGGLYMYNAHNIIIRNLTIEDASEDAIGITTGSGNIWVDHCTLSNAADGLLDIVRESSYVTVSYCVFRNHVKTMLIGHSDSASSDTGFLKVSVHHNWFDGSSSRHPRVRFGQVHVFNNYYLNNAEYGVASTMEADVLVEGNYFFNVAFPTFVGYAESGPGDLVERFNQYVNSGVPQTRGTAFEAGQYYSYTLDPASQVPSIVMSRAGAGKM